MQAAIESRYSPDSYCYAELKELVLDGCKIKQFTEEDASFLSTFQNLTVLSCSRTGLTSVQHLPSLPSLTKLELLDNALATATAHLDVLATATPNLRVLRLGGNRLDSVEQLIKDLTPLKFLEALDVEMNVFNSGKAKEEAPALAATLFAALPQLKVLDGHDAAGNELNDDDEDDDEEEEEEEENDEDDEDVDEEDARADLKAFYEKDFTAEDDEDDEDDYFNPLDQEEDEEEDDDDDEDDDLPDDEEEEDEEDDECDAEQLTTSSNGTTAATADRPRVKRVSNTVPSATAAASLEEADLKKQRI